MDDGEIIGDEVTGPTGTYRVRVILDDDAGESPRGFDGNVAVMVADAPRYAYPSEDADVARMLRDHDARVVLRYLRIFRDATVAVPLYQTGDGALVPGDPDDDGAGAVGVAFDTPTTRKVCGFEQGHRGLVHDAIYSELREYAAWASGEVYGYQVERLIEDGEDEDGPYTAWEDVEGVWGHIGYEWACQAARDELTAAAAEPLDTARMVDEPAATLAVRVNVLADLYGHSGAELDVIVAASGEDNDEVADEMAQVYHQCAADLREALARSV